MKLPGIVLIALLVGGVRMLAAPPGWLLADALLPAKTAATEPGAEILRYETIIAIGADGKWQQTMRYAMRVEHTGGAGFASLGIPYVDRADRVQRAEAWQVRAGKQVRVFPRREWLDAGETDGATLYSDFRSLAVRCPAAVSGDVFGGEVVWDRTSNAGQDRVAFGSALPTRVRRLEVRVPKGWTVRLSWLHGRGPEPAVTAEGKTWVWEARDLPAEKDEPWAPEQPLLAAALTIEPPPGPRPAGWPALNSWPEVARWLEALQAPQCDTSPALAATARRLTAGSADPAHQIDVLARYVQERRYIQVSQNGGLGFGYRPRKATEVLAADYGDCKDKANLLRALLREVGIDAHLVAAFAGDTAAVHPAWPSPAQFNHAIVMVRLPAGTDFPGAVDDPAFGRVLFFDATARWIPPGRLPWELQGGLGLVCSAATRDLVRFPRAEGNDEFTCAINLSLALTPEGKSSGRVVQQCQGQLAAFERAQNFALPEQRRREEWARRLNASVRGARVRSLREDAAPDGWNFTSTVEFDGPAIGQPLGSDRTLLTLDLLSRDSVPLFPDEPRQHDLLVPPLHVVHEVSLALAVRAECPAPRELHTEFGSYANSYVQEGDALVYRRRLDLTPRRVAPAEYAAFRRFLLEVAKADRTGVLVRLEEK
jgi:transglutaminase-like putative cysteine protease